MNRKLIIVCDDSLVLAEDIAEQLGAYQEFEVLACQNAGEVLKLVRERGVPDALIIERALAYGSVYDELDGDTDPRQVHAGLRVIRKLLALESRLPRGKMYVMLMHTASFPTSERDMRIIEWLEQVGKGTVLTKPFDSLLMEFTLCQALEVPCELPQNLFRDEEIAPNHSNHNLAGIFPDVL